MRRAVNGMHLYEQLLQGFFAPRGADVAAQAVVYNLYRTATDVIAAAEADALQPHGLTHAGFVLLMALWISGPREVRELAEVQRVSRPAIVSAVSTLERARLVRRVRSKTDRRLVRVELTAPGRSIIERVQRAHHRFERAVAGVLSRAEQRTLAELLRRVGRAVAPAVDPAAARATARDNGARRGRGIGRTASRSRVARTARE